MHPKLIGEETPNGRGTYRNYFHEMLRPIQYLVKECPVGTTDEIAVASDGVITGLSTVQLTALQAGVPAISLWSSVTEEVMWASSELVRHPLQEQGLVVINKPQSLLEHLEPPPPTLTAALRPYDPTPLAGAVCTLIGK
jgi:hypothetical protein